MSQYYGYVCKSCDKQERSLINRGSETLKRLHANFECIRGVHNLEEFAVTCSADGWHEAYLFLLHHSECAIYLTDEQGSFELALGDKEVWHEEYKCNVCKQETMHKCCSAGHERDSSGDYKECTECKERSEL